MVDFTKYNNPAIRIEAWDDDDTQYTLMDTIDGTSAKNYTLSASVSRHLNDRIGSFVCRISNKDGQFLNTFNGGEDIEIYVDYDTSVDENLYDNLVHFWNFDSGLKDSVGNSDFVNKVRMFLPFNLNATDNSGYDNNATTTDTVVTSDRLSSANSAFEFNGSTSVMSHPTTGFNASTGTILMWFKPDVVNVDQILYSNSQATGEKIVIGVDSSGNPYCYVGDSAQLVGSTTLVAGSNYCVMLAWGDSLVNMYINGYNDFTEASITVPSTLDSTHYIGADSDADNNFDGVIDCVVWYYDSIPGEDLANLYIDSAIAELQYFADIPFVRRIEATAYYPLDGNGTDASINGRNASINTNLIAHYKMNDDGYTKTVVDSKGIYHGQTLDYTNTISTSGGKINSGLNLKGHEYVNLDASGDPLSFYFTGTTNLVVNHKLNYQYPRFQIYGSAGEMIEPEQVSMDTLNQFTAVVGSVSPAYVKVYKEKQTGNDNDSYNYFHTQDVSTSAWSITHSLNDSYPVFTFFDHNSNVIEAESVSVGDANTITANFNVSTTGYAEIVTNSTTAKYLHTEASATTSWAVNHSLDTALPIVGVFDSTGKPVDVEGITITDADNLVIETGISTTGYARIITNEYKKVSAGFDVSDFHFSSWVSPQATVNNGAILSISDSSNVHKLTVGVASTGFPYVKDTAGTYYADSRIDDDSYHAIAFDYDATASTYNLYVDNTAEISSSYNLAVASTDKVSFGQEYSGAGGTSAFIYGYLDDFRIYDATLSADERARIYNSGSGTENEHLDGPQPTTDRFGVANKALNFDGSKDYVSTIADFPQHTDDCLFLAWVKAGAADKGIIFGNQWYFFVDVDGQTKFYDGSTLHPASTFTSLYTGGTTTGWHQVGFLLDSGSLYYVQDGVKSSVVDTGVNLTWSDGNFVIGNDSNTISNFSGDIDDVVVVDDVPTDALITDFYTYTSSTDWNDPYVDGVQNQALDLSGLKDLLHASITISGDNGAFSLWFKDVYVAEGDDILFYSDVNGSTQVSVNGDNDIKVTINGVDIIASLKLTASTYNHVVINWKTVFSKYGKIYLNNVAQTDWVVFDA